jgi:hypothetical protein
MHEFAGLSAGRFPLALVSGGRLPVFFLRHVVSPM